MADPIEQIKLSKQIAFVCIGSKIEQRLPIIFLTFVVFFNSNINVAKNQFLNTDNLLEKLHPNYAGSKRF